MSMAATELHIRCVSARNLRDTQTFGIPDPYCKVLVGNRSFQTRVHNNGGRSPVWNEKFVFPVYDISSEQICIEVKNKNMLDSKRIGECRIQISSFIHGEIVDQWFPLSYDRRGAGEINLRLQLIGAGVQKMYAAQPPQVGYPQQPASYGAPPQIPYSQPQSMPYSQPQSMPYSQPQSLPYGQQGYPQQPPYGMQMQGPIQYGQPVGHQGATYEPSAPPSYGKKSMKESSQQNQAYNAQVNAQQATIQAQQELILQQQKAQIQMQKNQISQQQAQLDASSRVPMYQQQGYMNPPPVVVSQPPVVYGAPPPAVVYSSGYGPQNHHHSSGSSGMGIAAGAGLGLAGGMLLGAALSDHHHDDGHFFGDDGFVGDWD